MNLVGAQALHPLLLRLLGFRLLDKLDEVVFVELFLGGIDGGFGKVGNAHSAYNFCLQ